MKQVRERRGKWWSDRSELITYAKIMSAYFAQINSCGGKGIDREIEKFCKDNELQAK